MCLSTFSAILFSSVLSNRFWQKVIWGKKMGAILAIEWMLSLYHHLVWSHLCYKWKSVTYSKNLHVLLTACIIFLSFLKWCHSTLFCNFNPGFKCLLSNSKWFSFTWFQWSCESNKLDYFATSFVVAINSLC